MLSKRDEWWVLGKVVEIRQELDHVWRAAAAGEEQRALLLLDVALEGFFRTKA